ncbi:MAG: lmo0937 family membrane protein, partial [Thermoanaerobaculia bacterium]
TAPRASPMHCPARMGNLLWLIIIILIILWLGGFTLHIGGALIHILIVIALILLIVRLATGRRVL